MFQTYQKNYQSRYLAHTWQQALRRREIAKNNYHVTGDLKKAKEFVKMVSNISFSKNITETPEHVIFSRSTISDVLAIPLAPALQPFLF